MLTLLAGLLDIADTLNREKIDYALCGGLALAVHGLPRFTRDIDMLVLPEDIQSIRLLVHSLGFRLEAAPMTFGARTGFPRTVHRVSKVLEDGELLTLDLLEVTSSLTQAWHTRERYEVDGHVIQTVSRAGLVSMKQLAGRDQDLVDIRRLTGDTDD